MFLKESADTSPRPGCNLLPAGPLHPPISRWRFRHKNCRQYDASSECRGDLRIILFAVVSVVDGACNIRYEIMKKRIDKAIGVIMSCEL
jgi:hypothetical protein